jgi:phage baseplate assembly protein W
MAQANLGCDVALELVDDRALSLYRAKDAVVRSAARRQVRTLDFVGVAGRSNLGQALVTRLLTPRGELARLGHPGYGSRLHEVIGRPNTPTSRNLAKLFVIEALKAERRVAKIDAVAVTPHPVDRMLILVAVSVTPVGEDVPLALSFGLEL